MLYTLLAKSAGYIAYYTIYYSVRCVYSMLIADPAMILLPEYL